MMAHCCWSLIRDVQEWDRFVQRLHSHTRRSRLERAWLEQGKRNYMKEYEGRHVAVVEKHTLVSVNTITSMKRKHVRVVLVRMQFIGDQWQNNLWCHKATVYFPWYYWIVATQLIVFKRQCCLFTYFAFFWSKSDNFSVVTKKLKPEKVSLSLISVMLLTVYFLFVSLIWRLYSVINNAPKKKLWRCIVDKIETSHC